LQSILVSVNTERRLLALGVCFWTCAPSTFAGEVERVLALGAKRLTIRPVTETGWRWHILADPDDNEFCVLQPSAGYW